MSNVDPLGTGVIPLNRIEHPLDGASVGEVGPMCVAVADRHEELVIFVDEGLLPPEDVAGWPPSVKIVHTPSTNSVLQALQKRQDSDYSTTS